MKLISFFRLFLIFSLFTFANSALCQYQMENLDRGLLATSMGGSKVFISWRWLGTEPDNITFNLYRGTTKLNSTPLAVCNYTDNAGSLTASYSVRAVLNGVEQASSKSVTPWGQQYLKVPIQAPAGGTSPDGVAYTYNANDASVADLDGDGEWEIILKWDPSNAKDNSQSGYTGNTYVDAYKLNGTRMWRIDFGVNIRSGAHYMDFMVYDFDSDGKAEMMCRTGDGTIDGVGTVIGNGSADYRTTAGYVLSGPEYISVFNGTTGKVMATSNYLPARGTVSSWGDNYGNRVDRFRAGVAYLDGQHPTGIFCRGYYTRAVVAAWDWKGGVLSNRWVFDSNNSANSSYFSQGDHSISIADVDTDGKQEVVVGSAIIDDNGTGYYNTTYGHGDALHVSDLDPDLPGIEVFNIQERLDVEGAYMYNAKSKQVLWTKPTLLDGSQTEGPGRGVCADISAQFRGAESWVAGGGISGVFDCKGNVTGLAAPQSCNFLVWWDGDLLRELLNNTMIDKYGTGRLLTAYNIAPISSNNGTKSNPCLSGDILGDWREEVIWRATANDALYIFSTNIASTYKFRTLMHNPQYRVAIAWQNTGYNQPPHVDFYLGDGMATPPVPNITIVGQTSNQLPTVSITAPANNTVVTAPASSITLSATAADADGTISKVDFYNGATLLNSDNTSPYSYNWTNVAAGTYTVTAKATDDKGGVTTSSAITIVVDQAPTVSITSPANNATFVAPASVTINANAADADGTISKVEFYNGTALLSTDNVSPYSYSWTGVGTGTYTLTAKATDNNGISTTSSVITIVVNNNQLPTVSITAPTNNTVVAAPASSITLTATAADADGTIAKVDFYNGATLLNSDNTSPYSYNWTNVAAGTYAITAKATDDKGGVTTSSVITIIVDQAPTVSIALPANNATFVAPASVTINANAADADGTISKVEFYNGAALLSTDNASPYSYSWTNVGTGTYSLTAKATDNNGISTTSSVITIVVSNNQPSLITINSPSDNASFTSGESVPVNVTASDPDGSISKVEYYDGNTLLGSSTSVPYNFAWDNPGIGTHVLTVKVTDSNGGTTVSSISIVVKAPNQLPAVTIISPINNLSIVAPAYVSINANATDVDGTILQVEFFNGTTSLGTDITSPYTYTWIGVPVGTYHITAKATDNEGGVTTSSEIVINVNDNQPSLISILSPVADEVIIGDVDISISASDPDGSITKVEYYDGNTLIGTSLSSPYDFTWANPALGVHTITVKVTDSNGGITTSSPVTFSNLAPSATGIFTNALYSSFSHVYPNPFSETFTILVKQEIKHLSVMNMYGEVVEEMNQINSNQKIELGESLPEGAYILMIQYNTDKVEVAKMVKVK